MGDTSPSNNSSHGELHEKIANTDHLETLPLEIKLHLLEYLKSKSFASLAISCKSWRSICDLKKYPVSWLSVSMFRDGVINFTRNGNYYLPKHFTFTPQGNGSSTTVRSIVDGRLDSESIVDESPSTVLAKYVHSLVQLYRIDNLNILGNENPSGLPQTKGTEFSKVIFDSWSHHSKVRTLRVSYFHTADMLQILDRIKATNYFVEDQVPYIKNVAECTGKLHICSSDLSLSYETVLAFKGTQLYAKCDVTMPIIEHHIQSWRNGSSKMQHLRLKTRTDNRFFQDLMSFLNKLPGIHEDTFNGAMHCFTKELMNFSGKTAHFKCHTYGVTTLSIHFEEK